MTSVADAGVKSRVAQEIVRGLIDPNRRIGEIDPRLFGASLEHLGRCVYTGIYEPKHPHADGHGFRTDVLQLARELGATIVRYPGGNFVSAYRWEDGVGPLADRPVRLDPAWRSIERNEFGTDEFIDWVRLVGAEPMLSVNLGTRGVDAACALVEYCNHPGGTARSDWRIGNGHPEPHAVPVWCLGNELDGSWQIGQKSAQDYGNLARETAKAIRLIDPSVELVACGSSSRNMPTFGTWDAAVLEHCSDTVDYISLHAYYEQLGEDLDSFLASACDMNAQIESVVATCDQVAKKLKSNRPINLSFDEWNVWYQARHDQSEVDGWHEHPALIEDVYSLADAIVVGTLLITLLSHADRVRIACFAQLVNAIGPIMTEPGGIAWRQTTFFPFALSARYVRSGVVLQLDVEAPPVDTNRYGRVPALAATAVWRERTGELVLLCTNRSRSRPLQLELRLRELEPMSVVEHVGLTGTDPAATNTSTDPGRVHPTRIDGTRVEGRRLLATLPALSWNLIRLARD
jgi:alpha-L-arabinofuranosidase